MCQGFIKDYRQELKSDIWIMPPLYHRVWQYLKYQVNHAENEIPMRDGSKFLIKKGQHLTSYRNIAKDIGWYEGLAWKEPNSKTIKTICDWLEKNKMIIQEHGKGNRQYTLITIVNWELYQGKDNEGVTVKKQQSNSSVTDGKQLADINKNDKECIKNEKNIIGDFTSNEDLIEAIKDFISMRKQIKKPMTDRAIKLMFKDLEKLSSNDDERIEILNQSIKNSWQGIFPLKKEGVQNGGNTNNNKQTSGKWAGYKPKQPTFTAEEEREIENADVF